MKFRLLLIMTLCGALVAPAVALADDGDDARVSALLEAMDLPVVTQELREAGVQEAQISETLKIIRERVPESGEEADAAEEGEERAATRATRLLRAEAETAREHGPMENLGEFVRDELDKGVTGQELAESIRSRREGRAPVVARGAAADRDRPEATDRERSRGEAPDEPKKRADDRRRGADDAPGGGEDSRPDEAGSQAGERRPDRTAGSERAEGAGEAAEDSQPESAGQRSGEEEAQERGRGRR